MKNIELNSIYNIDVRQGLKRLKDNSINCVVTSPPYWGLRDYNVKGQLGLEKTPEDYIGKMVTIFSEIKRVLKDNGTLWLNIGDSYAASGKGNTSNIEAAWTKKTMNRNNLMCANNIYKSATAGIKPKDLVGIPWMLAFALRADGWYLRQDIIWHKPNPMPESVNDRCTKAHEYIFLLSKSRIYYFDNEPIKEQASNNTHARQSRVKANNKSLPNNKRNGIRAPKTMSAPTGWDLSKGSHNKNIGRYPSVKNNESFNNSTLTMVEKRNKRSVWTVLPEAFKEAHFATFPQALIVDCIKAGCPENGVVLDPFMGSGTTAIVARKLNRNFIGFELNPEYVRMSRLRIHKELGLFK